MLSLNNIEVAYDRVFLAVKSISIDVPEGGLVALLGANGAGKSTTLKAISGLLRPERGEVTRGEITFAGKDLLALDPPDRVRLGIAHVLEGRRVFVHLTPRENLLAATSMHRDRRHVNDLARTDVCLVSAPGRARRCPGGLSLGRRAADAGDRARADDRAEAVAARRAESWDLRRCWSTRSSISSNASIGEAKVAVLLVEQNAAMALDIVQHAYLMESGRIVMSGRRRSREIQSGRSGRVPWRWPSRRRLSGRQALPPPPALARVMHRPSAGEPTAAAIEAGPHRRPALQSIVLIADSFATACCRCDATRTCRSRGCRHNDCNTRQSQPGR